MLGKRLIHPGVVASKIIEVHFNVIKALRIINPATYSLLDIIACTARSCLMNRNDAVRCVVSRCVFSFDFVQKTHVIFYFCLY